MGCDKADHTTEIGSLLGNTYMFALVSSEAACEISLNNGINCAQLIEFTSSNTATVIVTDIANIGTYTIEGNTLKVLLENSDTENPMIFNVNPEANELVRISDGSNDLWKLAIEGVEPWDL